MQEALDELAATPVGSPSGAAMQGLVTRLSPTIQRAVTRTLLAHGRGRVLTNLGAFVQEHRQLVFARLFERDARVLRIWDPDRGLSLRGWVGRFAALRTRDALRSMAADPWRDQAMPPDFFDQMVSEGTPEQVVATVGLWSRVRDQVRRGATDQGKQMFALLFEQDLSTQEIADATGLLPDAIFQWRRRLRREMKRLIADSMSGPRRASRT